MADKKRKTVARRSNASKQELELIQAQQGRITRQKAIAKIIFPALQELDTVYDAQTVVQAVSGFIKYAIETRLQALKVSDLTLDSGKGGNVKVRESIQKVLDLVANSSAEEVEGILSIMGQKFPEYFATKGLKEPMSSIPENEFIA